MTGYEDNEKRAGAREVALAEYTSLRAEIDRRAGVQWNVFALQIASAGAVGGIAIGSPSLIGLMLLIPMSSYMLGMRYVLHDFHIRLINEYIRDSLSSRVDDGLRWQQWKDQRVTRGSQSRRWLTPMGWNFTHPTRLAFVGVGVLAELAAIAGGVVELATGNVSAWIIIAYVLAVVADLLAIVVLDRAFASAT